MIDYLGIVKEFHETFGMPVGNCPQLISQKQFANRMRLIMEEISEYCKAIAENNIVEIADALADLLVVTFGTIIEHGLPMDKIFRQVGVSNMSKVGGHKDGSGKWIKPDSYTPVDLSWLKALVQKNDIMKSDKEIIEQSAVIYEALRRSELQPSTSQALLFEAACTLRRHENQSRTTISDKTIDELKVLSGMLYGSPQFSSAGKLLIEIFKEEGIDLVS